jgi:ribonuclease HI
MAKGKKFYVVWSGLNPGIYLSWDACQAQIKGVKGAVYKSFDSKEEAERAYASPAYSYMKKKADTPTFTLDTLPPVVERYALAVDAACSGNPGPMEYRGVYLGDGKEIFHFGPVHGTNNIGEFLAIVHALAMLDKQGLKMTIYSDSRTAISWVRKKCCKTQLERNEETEQLFQLIERAEAWLKSHRVTNPIVKWETEQWGEVPADFGRK